MIVERAPEAEAARQREDLMLSALAAASPAERKVAIMTAFCRGEMTFEEAAFLFYVFNLRSA